MWESPQCNDASETQKKSQETSMEYKAECTESKEYRKQEETKDEKIELGTSETHEDWLENQYNKLESFTLLPEAKANPVVIEAVATTPVWQSILVSIWEWILYASSAIWLTKLIKPIVENEKFLKGVQVSKLVVLTSLMIALRPFKLDHIFHSWEEKDDVNEANINNWESGVDTIEQDIGEEGVWTISKLQIEQECTFDWFYGNEIREFSIKTNNSTNKRFSRWKYEKTYLRIKNWASRLFGK